MSLDRSQDQKKTVAEQIAKAFHESYEKQAPEHNYETRKESAKPWSEVPQDNKNLMIAVVLDLLTQGIVTPGPQSRLYGPRDRSQVH